MNSEVQLHESAKRHQSKNGYWFEEEDSVWQLRKGVKVYVGAVRALLDSESSHGFTATLVHYASTLSADHTANMAKGIRTILDTTASSSITVATLINFRATLTHATEYRLGAVSGFICAWHDLGYPGTGWQLERWNYLAMRKYQESKSRQKTEQDKLRPASESPFRKQRTEKEIARVVMPRRWKALPATGAVAALIAERDERDHELAEQISRSFEWRRRSKAHVENDLGGVRSEKRVRVTVTLEDDLIRAAQSYTGIKQKSALIQTALTQLIEREVAKRLAAIGGTMPKLKEVLRRRSPGK